MELDHIERRQWVHQIAELNRQSSDGADEFDALR
jgi:hypothetical protein